MSFTRFHDDKARIEYDLSRMTGPGRYALDTPGQGSIMPFQEDPQMRMQQFAANLHTNIIHLESDLQGLTRNLNRDEIEMNNHEKQRVGSESIQYPTEKAFVQESRASHPAFMYRGLEQSRWEKPFLNPLDKIEQPFHHNIQTRILEKDNYKPTLAVKGDHF